MRPPRPRLEKDEEGDACKEARRRGWGTRKIRFLDARGGPDRLFYRLGRLVWIEFKKKGEKASAQQVQRHTELIDAGQEVYLCDTAEDALVHLT